MVWFTSKKELNRRRHAANGNNLSKDELQQLYNALTIERDIGIHGSITRTINRLAADGLHVSPKTVALSKRRWTDGGSWHFIAERRKGQGRKRKLTAAGIESARRAILGNTIRGTAQKRKFEGISGRMVNVDRQVLRKIALDENLECSSPKRRRIAYHSSHHTRFRIQHCVAALKKDEKWAEQLHYSDEQSRPISLGVNVKNDVIWVLPGQRSTTNIRRYSKGSEKQCFSLWWVISKKGVVCYYLYDCTMDVKFFHVLMSEHYKPARILADRRRRGKFESTLYHDHCMNSDELFEEKAMNADCGTDRWMKFSPKVCREWRGKMSKVPPSEKRCGYERKVMEPKEDCDCIIDDEEEVMVPTASPELNLAESAQGELRRRMRIYLAQNNKQWRGSTKTKMALLRAVIEKLHTDKRYWKALFDGLRGRWRWVVEHDGALLKK